MPILTADELVARITTDLNDKKKVLEAALHLQQIHEDLIADTDPSKSSSLCTTKFMSSDANNMKHEFEYESVNGYIIISLYTTTDGYKLYTLPPNFIIAKKNEAGFGWVPVDNWTTDLEKYKVNQKTIDKIKDVLEQNKPVMYKD
jgi:hypothetical protein